MLTDSVVNDDAESTSLPTNMTDDSCRLEYIEIVPLTRDTDDPRAIKCEREDWSAEVKQEMLTDMIPLTGDTDGPCTTECDSGDWSAEVKQENLPVVKEEPDDVCCIIYCLLSAYN